MKLLLIKNGKIRKFILPDKVSGNFWVTNYDENGNEKNIINIQANSDNEWELVSNNEYYAIVDSKKVPYVNLKENNTYIIKESLADNMMTLYTTKVYDSDMKFYSASTSLVTGITIGRTSDCKISYNVPYLNDKHAQIILNDKDVYIKDFSTNYGTYVNEKKVIDTQKLNIGDIIFIMGLKIILLKIEGTYVLGVNDPNNLVKTFMKEVDINSDNSKESFEEPIDEKDMILYNEDDYFHKKPRFIYSVKCMEMQIDPPPNKSNKQDIPMILTIGPMMTMSLTSVVMIYTTVNNVLIEESTWEQSIPSLIVSGAMMVSFLLWPILTNLFQKHLEKKNEKLRQKKYSEYVEKKKNQIMEEKKSQEEILKKSYPTLIECERIIDSKDDRLWEKRIEDDDFFSCNLGIGSMPMNINIKFPDDHFTMTEDNLKDDLKTFELVDKNLIDVPIPFSFKDNYISAIIGDNHLTFKLLENILMQLVTFHSYDNLKIAIFTTKDKEDRWDDIKILPHIFSNDKTVRYFSSDNDEYKEITYNLERIYNERIEKESSNKIEKTVYNPSYLIITDSFNSVRNYDFIKNIVESKKNYGFSILILSDKISSLPDQCQTFIEISDNESKVFKNIANSEEQKFKIDLSSIDMYKCSKELSNIPIEINDDNEGAIPKKVGFLEMYEIGKVEQLNSINRWEKNVPILNMAALVGIGKNGEKISLDLHEKYHGPHGLIAGMTGSGKSEFIITYILSMAINYHPYEVQFILIDYKGGGLAGAFENKSLGYKLPHLVGVITNLDKNEINRSLASIESELKRRQALFNKAREISGESTVDIYKYQKMYRNHVVDEPVSHLFIIADEFAELKTQQPEFMDQLISTARIGRSLGVHLILATQKPSGVVDSQIWSNTRFRVCLRVQEKSDSAEVIQCPDAAFLTQTGRFYLQVGYNEIFQLGQSAWAGGQYIPSENIKKTIDSSLSFINNTGYVIKNVESKEEVEILDKKGEELLNIVKYLQDCAEKENIHTKPLWLSKMPSYISVTDLINKYNYKKEKFILNPVIGEYDVPNMQKQHILTIPFTEEGNLIVYGMAGSGKENFITTMIYSSSLAYTPDEVNYYILDFGAEVLRYFDNCPIVGDILYVGDAEKVKNLFKMISDKIEERKKLFSSYNGDYVTYCQKSGKTVPNIVIVINNYEAYAESYPEFDDLIIILTRDCIKYGIYFVFACNTPDGMRFKLKQNFGQSFVLQQNNEDDYVAILGNTKKLFPSKIFGRGLIKKEEVYEFQTAFAGPIDDLSKNIKILNEKLISIYNSKAPKIPILPEVVTYDELDISKVSNDEIIIGIDKSDLEICSYNFNKNHINIVTTQDFTLFNSFINPFVKQFSYKENYSTIIINADECEVDKNILSDDTNYVDSNFDSIFKNIIDYLENCNNVYKQNNFNKDIFNSQKKINCIIIGINSLKNKLNDENKNRFSDIFSIGSELNILNFVFVDSIDKIKMFEYESWYKSSVNTNDGIWLGNGINDQFSINITQKIPEIRQEIPYNFCFVIKRGKPVLVKFIEK